MINPEQAKWDLSIWNTWNQTLVIRLSVSVSPSSVLRFKDLVPVLYQEGRYQGDPVTLGVGGFGRVELVRDFLCLTWYLMKNLTMVLVKYIYFFSHHSKMTTVNHGTYYAMKRVSKKHIVAKRQEEHMLFEKKILKAIQCDFIVRYPSPSPVHKILSFHSQHTIRAGV